MSSNPSRYNAVLTLEQLKAIYDDEENLIQIAANSVHSSDRRYSDPQQYRKTKRRIDEFHTLETWWYKNGTKSHEGMLKNGKPHGLETWWWENGLKRSESTHIGGKDHGVTTLWWENGKKLREEQYLNNEVYSQIEWDEEGNIITANFPTPPPIPETNPLNRLKNLALLYSRALMPSQTPVPTPSQTPLCNGRRGGTTAWKK